MRQFDARITILTRSGIVPNVEIFKYKMASDQRRKSFAHATPAREGISIANEITGTYRSGIYPDGPRFGLVTSRPRSLDNHATRKCVLPAYVFAAALFCGRPSEFDRLSVQEMVKCDYVVAKRAEKNSSIKTLMSFRRWISRSLLVRLIVSNVTN